MLAIGFGLRLSLEQLLELTLWLGGGMLFVATKGASIILIALLSSCVIDVW